MKIDKNAVRSLSEMPDERLFRTLKFFASALGMEMPERQRNRFHYEAIRRTLGEITDGDIARMNEISDMYKRYKNERRGGGFR